MSEFLTQNALKGTQHPNAQISDHSLLFDLGIRGMQRMAGYIPAVTRENLPETAPHDEKPLCDEVTTRQFHWLMRNNYRGLRFVWLQKFSETGFRLPDELIPMVMDNQRSTFGVFRTPQFHEIIGNRAKWLADISQNRHWLWFHSEGSRNNNHLPNSRNQLNRAARYKQLRSADNSEEAEMWLIEYWEKLATNDRISILDTMLESLKLDDLPFLLEQEVMLDENRDSGLVDKVWYMISLLHPERFEGFIQDILQLVQLEFMGRNRAPIFDLRWSNSFCHPKQYKGRNGLRKLAAKHRWWDNMEQLIRLVPLDYWLDTWNVKPETLLTGAHHGLNSELFLPIWVTRTIDENHESFALDILKHQKPFSFFFGWRASTQTKLLDCLSFSAIQQLLNEAWMNPSKETTWQIN